MRFTVRQVQTPKGSLAFARGFECLPIDFGAEPRLSLGHLLAGALLCCAPEMDWDWMGTNTARCSPCASVSPSVKLGSTVPKFPGWLQAPVTKGHEELPGGVGPAPRVETQRGCGPRSLPSTLGALSIPARQRGDLRALSTT